MKEKGESLQRQKGEKGNSKGGRNERASPMGQKTRLATGEEGTGKEAHPSEDLRTCEP